VIAAVAALIALSLAWLGRGDVTRPAVAFGVIWFGFVALAQLQLTELEHAWSSRFALTALGGGVIFVVAATLAGGTEGARGRVGLDRDALRARPLVVAALVLLAGAIAGAAYKASVLDGIPLLSENPDRVRGRAFRSGADLPSWSSALTSGFYISFWCALAALWVQRGRLTRIRALALCVLAAVALFGVSLDASRNILILAVGVPLVAAYLVARPQSARRRATWVAVGLGVLAISVSGLFLLRLARGDSGGRDYIERELDRQPAALRPLLPAYVNGVLPLEAARRVDEAVPARYSYRRGAASLTSLPNAAFPGGRKPFYGNDVADLMRGNQPGQITWSVASYQGRLLADLGWRGVLLGSALLGLAFGALYRWARERTGLLAVALIGYCAYYSALMVYDNQLSFSVIAVYDLAVVALVGALARTRPG
jgi:hypothetical protein